MALTPTSTWDELANDMDIIAGCHHNPPTPVTLSVWDQWREELDANTKNHNKKVQIVREMVGHFPHSTPDSPTTARVESFVIGLANVPKEDQAQHLQTFADNTPPPRWCGVWEKDSRPAGRENLPLLHALVRAKSGIDPQAYPEGVRIYVGQQNGVHGAFMYQYSTVDVELEKNRDQKLKHTQEKHLGNLVAMAAASVGDNKRRDWRKMRIARSYVRDITNLSKEAQEDEATFEATTFMTPYLQKARKRREIARGLAAGVASKSEHVFVGKLSLKRKVKMPTIQAGPTPPVKDEDIMTSDLVNFDDDEDDDEVHA